MSCGDTNFAFMHEEGTRGSLYRVKAVFQDRVVLSRVLPEHPSACWPLGLQDCNIVRFTGIGHGEMCERLSAWPVIHQDWVLTPLDSGQGLSESILGQLQVLVSSDPVTKR